MDPVRPVFNDFGCFWTLLEEPDPWKPAHGAGSMSIWSMSICSWIRIHEHMLMNPDPWAYAHGTGSMSICSWNGIHEHMLMDPDPWAYARGSGSSVAESLFAREVCQVAVSRYRCLVAVNYFLITDTDAESLLIIFIYRCRSNFRIVISVIDWF